LEHRQPEKVPFPLTDAKPGLSDDKKRSPIYNKWGINHCADQIAGGLKNRFRGCIRTAKELRPQQQSNTR
jgi:hypothetical protein